MKAHQEGTVEERHRTLGSSSRTLWVQGFLAAGTQGKAHIAGLAWDVKGQQAAYAAGAERVRERK